MMLEKGKMPDGSTACEHFRFYQVDRMELGCCPFAGGAEDGAWVCYHCSKNTAKGLWPAKESLPQIHSITVKGVPRDPQVAAAVQRQQAGCRGCGDPGALGEGNI